MKFKVAAGFSPAALHPCDEPRLCLDGLLFSRARFFYTRNFYLSQRGQDVKTAPATGKMVVNYAQKGLKITLGAKEYTAWAVQNEIDPQTSYFIRATGMPDSIIFGPFSPQDDAEVFVLQIT